MREYSRTRLTPLHCRSGRVPRFPNLASAKVFRGPVALARHVLRERKRLPNILGRV